MKYKRAGRRRLAVAKGVAGCLATPASQARNPAAPRAPGAAPANSGLGYGGETLGQRSEAASQVGQFFGGDAAGARIGA